MHRTSMMLAVILSSGCAHTPPGGSAGLAGLQKAPAAPMLQTTIRRKPIELGPNLATVERGVGGLADAGLHDGNPSGGLCAWSGVVQGAYAGTKAPRAGDAPIGDWCVALAACANARVPNKPSASARSALLQEALLRN
jgi:hypothetical protein